MPEPVKPIPKRFAWLKRLSLAFAVFILMLIGLRLWWGHRANARLDTLIAEIQAKGEPIHFDDLLRDPVPDHDNKAYYLRQVLTQWPTVPGQSVVITETDWYKNYDDVNPHPDPITDNAAYLEQVKALLPLLEQADTAPDTDWGVVMQSPAINIFPKHYGEARQLARLLMDAAERSADIGNTELTLRLIDAARIISDSLDQPPYMLIVYLASVSIDALSQDTAESLLPQLHIAADPDDPGRKLAELLLNRWLNEETIDVRQKRSWIDERWMFHDTTRSLYTGQMALGGMGIGHGSPGFLNSALLTVIRPILVNDAAMGLQHAIIYVDVSSQAKNYSGFNKLFLAEVDSRLGEDFYEKLENERLILMITGLLLPAGESVSNTNFRYLTKRRLAATALAIKLYEADHGDRPDSLDQLVPDYLPAVPLDPFTSGDTLKYRPGGTDMLVRVPIDPGDGYNGYGYGMGTPLTETIQTNGPAVVYSVGIDGVDHHGTVIVDEKGKHTWVDEFEDYQVDDGFLLDTPDVPAPVAPDADDVDEDDEP